MKLTIKIPGKLYLIGEYHILDSGSKAVIAAVNRFLTVTIEDSDDYQFSQADKVVHYYSNEKGLFFDDATFYYTKQTIEHTFKYLEYLKIEKKIFSIQLNHELNSDSGNKYGLGSSAAIMVGIAKAILLFHHVNLNEEQLFKLAVLNQRTYQKITSGGDLACVTYGKTIIYQRYDVAWLLTKEGHDFNLLNEPWPRLNIEILPNIDHNFYIVYSGVSDIKETPNIVLSKAFHDQAEQLVNRFIDGYKQGKKRVIFDTINAYQSVLEMELLREQIEFKNDSMVRLFSLAEQLGFASKQSGAGRGDCVIFYHYDDHVKLKALDLPYEVLNKIFIGENENESKR